MARKLVGHESDGRARDGQGHAASRGDERGPGPAARPRRVRLPSRRRPSETTGRRTSISVITASNAADSLRNGGRVRGTAIRVRRSGMLRFVRSVWLCLGVSGGGPCPSSMACTRARSAGSSTACGAGRANRAEHDHRVVPPGPIATDPPRRQRSWPLGGRSAAASSCPPGCSPRRSGHMSDRAACKQKLGPLLRSMKTCACLMPDTHPLRRDGLGACGLAGSACTGKPCRRYDMV